MYVFVFMFTCCANILHARILHFLIGRNVFRCPRDFCMSNGRAGEERMDYYYLIIRTCARIEETSSLEILDSRVLYLKCVFFLG